MADLISTDHPLTADQRAVLSALLDALVPASADGAMPSAADVGFEGYLHTQAADFVPVLAGMLPRFDAAFAAMPLPQRCEQLAAFSADQPALFTALLTRVYDCYYQDDRVRRAIGVATGAPFPQGNTVEPGDLSLLDPVIRNAARHRYRRP